MKLRTVKQVLKEKDKKIDFQTIQRVGRVVERHELERKVRGQSV